MHTHRKYLALGNALESALSVPLSGPPQTHSPQAVASYLAAGLPPTQIQELQSLLSAVGGKKGWHNGACVFV